MRINKYLSNLGYCSRKTANQWIEAGRVTINGHVSIPGEWMEPEDDVRVDGRPVKQQPGQYIILNKPVGIVCTAEPEEKNNVIEYLNLEAYIFPVGRLDKDSEGLLLLTNDGDLANQLLNAAFEHEKEYRVVLDRPYDQQFIDKMQQGISIKGITTRPCTLNPHSDKTFDLILSQGMNRQIRKMCSLCGYKVLQLQRIRLLNIHLGDLPYGTWRHLTEDELETLRRRVRECI